MHGFLLLSPSKVALGTVMASLATDGFRHGVRNHGYRINDYASLFGHSRGSVPVGIRHLPKGRASSLLCLCGISVSLAFYVLYLKFYPQFYYSAFLKRIIKRLLQNSSQRHAYNISSRRKRTLPQTASFSISNDHCSSNNNNSKTSDADTGVCSVVGSLDSSRQDGTSFGEFHQMPASAFSSAAAAAAAEMRMRHRITSRRRTLSDSPDVVARLDDFICLFPEIVYRPQHIQRTRNVLDWLAQIDVDPDNSLSLSDGDQLDDFEAQGGQTQTQARESTLSRNSTSCGRVHQSCDNGCQECLSGVTTDNGGRRSGRRFADLMNPRTMDVERQDQGRDLSTIDLEDQDAGLQQQRKSCRMFDAVSQPRKDNWLLNNNSSAQGSMLEGTQERGSEVGEVKRPDKDGGLGTAKPGFYFEDDFDDFSDKGILSQSVHFDASPGHAYLPDTLPRKRHRLGSNEFSSIDGPQFGGTKGYDWLRVRILGAGRKQRISTGSGLPAEFLSSRCLRRNHHSFNSAISGTSTEYAYRESLVSKGISIDCGEDLDDLVIPGDDLLEAAEFSRRTLTNIDQLHQELEVIQRNITYINQKVEVLQFREDLPNSATLYRYGLEQCTGNDLPVIDATVPRSGYRRTRSRSLSLTPGDVDLPIVTLSDIENAQHSAQADGLVWDYGSDLALNPVYSHHRSLSGLACEADLSNRLRTRRSRSDETELTFRRDLSPDDLPLTDSDDDSEGDPEVTDFAQLPVRQHNDSTCDEYFEDDYTLITHLHH